MRRFRPARVAARSIACAVFAGTLAACGHGTPLTSGTATPPPPVTPSVTAQYSLADSGSQPAGITLGSDGNLWFTEFKDAKIGQLNQQGIITENVTPTAAAGPTGIASGPNGLVWFAETNVAKVGQIALQGPTFVDFQLPEGAARPVGIALGSDGNMWLTDPATDQIWRVGQTGSAISCHVSPGAKPLAIVEGPDGAMWFTEPGINKIGRLPSVSGCNRLAEFPIATKNSGPAGIASGTDNGLWFIERRAKKIARITVTGQLTNEFSLAPAQDPNDVIEGIDGNFFFTDTAGNHIGRFVTKTQKVSLYKVPTAGSQPTAMAIGPDQLIYITLFGVGKIAQFTYF